MARQVLENGVIIPAEYSDDWYDDMTSNLTKLDDVIGSDSEKLSSADVGAAALSNSYNDLDNLPTIPTKTSDLTNDSNFVDTSNPAVASGITSAKVTSYDSHVADTDIHVTTADKATWNTVTSKANDSDVVHKSGDETVGGQKIFSHVQIGVGRDLYLFTPNPYNKDTPPANISYQYIWFTGNSASQGLTNHWYGGYIEHRVYPNGSAQGRWFVRDTSKSGQGIELFVNGNDKQFRPQGNNTIDLGTPTNKWKSFNGLNPGSLSLPSGNVSDVIDISSYLVNLDGHVNTYTAPANGWISIAVVGTAIAIVSSSWSDSRLRASSGNVRMLYPVLKNETVSISVVCTTLDYARFIPCQGNV